MADQGEHDLAGLKAIERRDKRKRVQRAKTAGNPNRTSDRELLHLRLFNEVNYPRDVQRPRTRGDCMFAPRPCPWVSCRWHLFLDVNHVGSIKLNFPDLEPWELKASCVLDVAAQGGATLEEVAELLNVTRERVRQIDLAVRAKLDPERPVLAGLLKDFDEVRTHGS